MADGFEALSRVRIVLVRTTHPGNIGASARAMKTMGLTRLCLVAPARFPCAEATARAAGADDLLYAAEVSATLDEALRGCSFVVGTSARARSLPWPVASPRACVVDVLAAARWGEVALVFGPEHSGLDNREVEMCQRLIRIPTAPGFSSLNLAAAVQVLAYELSQAAQPTPAPAERPEARPATADELALLYAHLESTMTSVGFFDPAHPKRLMRRMKRLLQRAGLDLNELNILRGFLAAIEDSTRR